MNEIKELRKPAKRRGIQEVLGTQKSTGFYKNRGYKYVLVCIDGYSKYLMARKLKSKNATEVTHAMKDIIQTYGPPKHICSDRGTEFTNSIFRTNILILYTEKTEPSNMTAKDTTPQFHVGDYVRVTRKPRILEKRLLTSKWSNDLYEVVDIDDRFMPLMYEVKNVETVAHRSVIIGYSWRANVSHSQHHPSLDPRVEKNPMH